MQYLYQNMQYVHVIIQASHSQRIVCYSLKLTLSLLLTYTHAHTQRYKHAGRQRLRQRGAEHEHFEPFRRWPWTCCAVDRERRLPMTADTHTHTHTHTRAVWGVIKATATTMSLHTARYVLCDENLDPCLGLGLGPTLGLGLLQLLALPTHPHARTHTRTYIHTYMCILNLYCAFAFEFAWPHTTLHMCLTQNLENAPFLERR